MREIEQQRDAFTRPIAETQVRVTALRKTIDDARRALSDLGYLFTAEQHRLTPRATDRFVEIARDYLRRVDADDGDLEIDQHFRKRRGFYVPSSSSTVLVVKFGSRA